ncbi:MAG: NUDIX hydrolase [Planctomycetota bacterium]|nr:NUDIX hydrolase [Planctomycetota bacterium]
MADGFQREVLHRGRKFDFERVTWSSEDGARHTLEVVRHPGAVVVLGILEDGRVTLIRNRRPAVGKTVWEAPAGTLEPEESPSVCAKRELREEAGFEAGRIVRLGEFFTTPGMTDERMHAFAALDLREVGQALEGGEEIEVELIDGREAIAMVERGELDDAKSMLAVLMAERAGLIGGKRDGGATG